MNRKRPTIKNSLVWCLTLQCPSCGRASVFERLFSVRETCESCGVVYKREEGFFVGALLIAVVTTELVILLAYLASLPFIAGHYQIVIALLFSLAVLFPALFYHHSWSIWLTFDHFVEGLPGKTEGRGGNG